MSSATSADPKLATAAATAAGAAGVAAAAPSPAVGDALSLLMAEKKAAAAASSQSTKSKPAKGDVKKPAGAAVKKRRLAPASASADDADGDENDDGKKEVEDDGEGEEDEDETTTSGPLVLGRKPKGSARGASRGGRGAGAGAGGRTRLSAVKIEMEMKLLKREVEYSEKEIARLNAVIEKLEREKEQGVAKLEKQIADERLTNQRFQQQVDGQKTNMMADLTYHMAKSHHSAMQTIQTSQTANAQVLASALGQSIIRLKDKGNRLKELMPPLPDLKQPNAKQIYHEQVAAFLTKNVTKVDDGDALLKKIDSTIADTQQTIDDERKRISPTLTPHELADLQHTLEEEQTRIAALKYERDMLAVGLAKQHAQNSKSHVAAHSSTPNPNPNPNPTSTPTPTPAATPFAAATKPAPAAPKPK